MSSLPIQDRVHLNLDNCSKQCSGCVFSYLKENFSHEEKFRIQCKGIPSNFISTYIKENLSDPEQEYAVGLLDPVTWARTELGVDCRPHQVEILRCTARRKVIRAGRRTGKTYAAVIHMLHSAMHKDNYKILVVAPQDSHVKVSLDILKTFIMQSTKLQNSISHMVNSPRPIIEFSNGSRISFFTAGTASGSGAQAVRGQPGDAIYLDECDYLSPEDVNTTLAILTESPHTVVWAYSTPSGARQHFYDWFQSATWKSYHFPSPKYNPYWNKEMEEEARELAGTDRNYRAEYLAEFPSMEEGVYQERYIEAAKLDYRYADQKPTPGWLYTFGVDWNGSGNGTQIVVVGYNPHTQKHMVVERDAIHAQDQTQHVACQSIIELNRKWQPLHIYADSGYGTAIEILHKFGADAQRDPNRGPGHPDSRLRKIAKSFEFGGNVEIFDLVTKQVKKKKAKPFLIENSVRRFEQNEIYFSLHDKLLEKQLYGYVISNFSNIGLPQYKASNKRIGDHTLDALNLALVAFTLELSPFGLRQTSTNLGFSGQIGEAHVREEREQSSRITVFKDEHSSRTKHLSRASKSLLGTDSFPGVVNVPEMASTRPGWSSDTEHAQDIQRARVKSAKMRRKARSPKRSTF